MLTMLTMLITLNRPSVWNTTAKLKKRICRQEQRFLSSRLYFRVYFVFHLLSVVSVWGYYVGPMASVCAAPWFVSIECPHLSPITLCVYLFVFLCLVLARLVLSWQVGCVKCWLGINVGESCLFLHKNDCVSFLVLLVWVIVILSVFCLYFCVLIECFFVGTFLIFFFFYLKQNVYFFH